MRISAPFLPFFLVLGGCSLFNQVDDLKHLASDTGTNELVEAGDEAVEEAGPITDGGSVTKDVGVSDTSTDAGSTPVIVIGGPLGDGGTVVQLAALEPSTGKEIGPNNRMSLPAGKKLGGLLYDGEREDLFYVFETDPNDTFAPALLHVMHLVTRTGTWKEVSAATSVPAPSGDPGLVALHNTIVYKTNIQGMNGGPASVGVAFINTKQAEDGVKVVPISVGTAPVLALPFIPRGVIGIPHPGDNSLQDIDIVSTDPFPCTTVDDAGTPFCGVYLHRVTISSAGVSPVQMVTVPTGKFLWQNGAGISWSTDLVNSLGLIVYPPVAYDGMGQGQGSVQQYSDDPDHTTQLNPSIAFGPVKGPWLVGTALAQCERIVLTMGFIQNPWLYAIPLDRNGVTAVSMQTIENGGNLVYEPTSRTILAPNGTDLRPFALGGTHAAPTLTLKTTDWMAPRDINVAFAVAKVPLFPTCQ